MLSTQAANLQVDVMAFLMPQDHARLMRHGDVIPRSLDAGFDLLGNLDHDWIWVLESEGEIKGVLVASPCHGCAFIWRLAVMPEMPHSGVIRLLRRFARDIRERRLKGYLTILGSRYASETRLKGIVEKLGGKDHGEFTLMASGLPREGV